MPCSTIRRDGARDDARRPASQREIDQHGALDRTLFVEAGAGTGKTTQLVEAHRQHGARPTWHLAGRHRSDHVHRRGSVLSCRRVSGSHSSDGSPIRTRRMRVRQQCEQAVADADLAAISTVHGFASRHPRASSLSRPVCRRGSRCSTRSRRNSPTSGDGNASSTGCTDSSEHEELLYRAALIDVPLAATYPGQPSFKDVAANFGQNWDRLDDLLGDGPPAAAARPDRLLARSTRRSRRWPPRCRRCGDPNDKLVRHIEDSVCPRCGRWPRSLTRTRSFGR